MAVKIIKDLGFAINRTSETSSFHGVTVHPTFFFDNASARQKESAESWASNVNWRHPGPHGAVLAKVRPNTPMTNLWLDNLETRMEGGRAYKVINKDDFTYFDVREDQMLQAILKHGIQPGGKIGGEWVFAMNGTQCKCFLVDSVEYQEVLARVAIQPAVMVKAKTKNLKIGTIYSNKNMDVEFIYVGFLAHNVITQYVRKDWRTGAITVPEVRELKNKHTFITKKKWYANENVYYYLETPSTVYETGRVTEPTELLDILKTNLQPNYVQIDVQSQIIDKLST